MKKHYLVLFLSTACLLSFSQQNWYWFNPFNFTIGPGYPPAMCKDKTGQFWFGASDGFGTTISNQGGGTEYSVPGQFLSNGDNIFIDSRNEIWVNFNGTFTRIVNGSPIQFDVPALITAGPHGTITVVDDNKGSEFVYGYKFVLSNPDSMFFFRFDGTLFHPVDVSTLPFNFSISPSQVLGLICDTAGKLYACFSGAGMYSYDGQAWSLADTSKVQPLFKDSRNNLYFETPRALGETVGPNDYVLKIHGNSAEKIIPPHINQPDHINYNCWAIDKQDKLWYICNTGYFFRLDSAGWTSVYTPDFCCHYANNWTIPPALFDTIGNIWFANDMDPEAIGIYSFRGHKTFKGNVFIDYDLNHQRDSADLPLRGINILQTPENLVANSDNNGDYSLAFLNNTGSYTLLPPALHYYYVSSGSNLQINPATDSTCCYNIAYTPLLNVQDLEISATSGFARPGFDVSHWLSYKNTGTVTVSDTIVYALDPRYNFIAAQPAPDVVTTDTLKWAFQNLHPFELRNIYVQLQLNTGVTVGNLLSSTAVINPLSGDTTPLNNTAENKQLVVASFDPNEKTVYPEGSIAAGDKLTYTIFFQNTGTDTAFNVFVRDTLDTDLDLASFEILGYSHPMEYTFKGAGIVEFRFANILLPDSQINEARSHGFVKYAVRAKANLNNGTAIRNTAFIFFDFNSPVETNTTVTGIGFLDIPVVEKDDNFIVYPNPNAGVFTIDLKENTAADRVTIADILGNVVISATLKNRKQQISFTTFSPGVYTINILSSGLTTGRKRIVLR